MKYGVVFLLILVLFNPIYASLYERFTARDSYYSHGFLIPFISLFLVWRKRRSLGKIALTPDPWGILLLFGGVFLHLLSTLLKINISSYIALPTVLLGTVLFLGGRKLAREFIFPIGFLLFMLPLPQVLIIGIAFKMKIFAAHISMLLGRAIGIDAHRVGSTIYYPKGFMVVGDTCSGFRSLITFLALGALFTQFSNSSLWRKGALFLATIPIALISNISRLVFLLIVSYVYGEEVALGFVHDFAGFMVFVIGFIGFIQAAKLLRCELNKEITS